MGVWALPQTVKQAKELQKLVAKPLSPTSWKPKKKATQMLEFWLSHHLVNF
jgi:hypothetical protein